ncbi:hypothetical protein T4B_9177 [Trichinella pseudospiralis]|uniref:Uncharacterized protein n=1 Tax=Trichinella pseudospiralis TaxID=6337 RepID=A0A0V1GFD2_TRIPS|nr:hypothetical protein T4B_9177 [Trichinella pseudospiralis]
MTVYIHLCISQALAEPLRRQLYQALSASSCGAVSGWSFLQSLLHTLSL